MLDFQQKIHTFYYSNHVYINTSEKQSVANPWRRNHHYNCPDKFTSYDSLLTFAP